jgi:hypothetical protein
MYCMHLIKAAACKQGAYACMLMLVCTVLQPRAAPAGVFVLLFSHCLKESHHEEWFPGPTDRAGNTPSLDDATGLCVL